MRPLLSNDHDHGDYYSPVIRPHSKFGMRLLLWPRVCGLSETITHYLGSAQADMRSKYVSLWPHSRLSREGGIGAGPINTCMISFQTLLGRIWNGTTAHRVCSTGILNRNSPKPFLFVKGCVLYWSFLYQFSPNPGATIMTYRSLISVWQAHTRWTNLLTAQHIQHSPSYILTCDTSLSWSTQ